MRSYRTEVKLNKEQERLYKLCIAAQRTIWNLFIEENDKSEKYINNYAFSKWFNNEYLPTHEAMHWLKEAGSKTLQHTMRLCHGTYIRAFEKKSRFPKKKSCKSFNEGYYFVRGGLARPIKTERHRIKVPIFGWVTIKEKGYLPLEGIISGTIKKRANKYFISVLTDEEPITYNNNTEEGIGIDLGIKELMTCSNGMTFDNINKTFKIKKLEKKLKREQRALSRKYEVHKRDKEVTYKNFNKNKLRVQKLNYKLECARNDYINKCIEIIIEQKPKFIALEELSITNLRKNRHLSKAISDCKFYYTKQRLIQKAQKNGIEVREVDRFYPSSKTCSHCGEVKKDLKLSDRTYKCSKCGLELDRDFNASLNLKNAKEYKILTTGGLPESNDYGLYKNLGVAIQPTAESKTIQDEIVKSQFVFKAYFDEKRSIAFNRYELGSRRNKNKLLEIVFNS